MQSAACVKTKEISFNNNKTTFILPLRAYSKRNIFIKITLLDINIFCLKLFDIKCFQTQTSFFSRHQEKVHRVQREDGHCDQKDSAEKTYLKEQILTLTTKYNRFQCQIFVHFTFLFNLFYIEQKVIGW